MIEHKTLTPFPVTWRPPRSPYRPDHRVIRARGIATKRHGTTKPRKERSECQSKP